MGISSSRGQACVPINRSGSAQPVTSDGFAVVVPAEEEVDETEETDFKPNELAALPDRSEVEFRPLPRLKFFRWDFESVAAASCCWPDFLSENVIFASR